MRVPRVRFTIRLMMIAIVLAALVFAGFAAKRERQRRNVALSAAEAAFIVATLNRMHADLAAAEFEHGIYKQQLSAADAEISRAESELKAGRAAADPEVRKQAKTGLERAQNQRKALEKSSIDVIKEMKYKAIKARAEESARKGEYQRAKASVTGWLW